MARRQPRRQEPPGAVCRGDGGIVWEYGADPRCPNQVVRRARRVDPLWTLYHCGGITGRGYDAGEELRNLLERMEPSVCSGGSEVHVAPYLRAAISTGQIGATREAREALERLDADQRAATAWVCLGGTVDGLALRRRIRRASAAAHVASGLDTLADHFFGRREAAA